MVGLEDLIALKLYAGGPKSKADIAELFARNTVDPEKLKLRCEAVGLDREVGVKDVWDRQPCGASVARPCLRRVTTGSSIAG